MSNTYNSASGMRDDFIIVSCVIDDGDGISAPTRLVVHPSHRAGEWVCHYQNLSTEGLYWGFYGTFDEAMLHYYKRCGAGSFYTDVENSKAFQAKPEVEPLDLSTLKSALRSLSDLAEDISSSVSSLESNAEDIEAAVDEIKTEYLDK